VYLPDADNTAGTSPHRPRAADEAAPAPGACNGGRQRTQWVVFLGAADNIARPLLFRLCGGESAGRQVSKHVFSPSLGPPCLLVGTPIPLRLSPIFLANLLPRMRLRPRRHPREQHFFQRPHVLRQASGHRWRTGPPQLRCAMAVGWFRNQQRLP